MIQCEQMFEVDETKPFMPFSGTGKCVNCGHEDEVFVPEGLARLNIKPGETPVRCGVCDQTTFIISA